jgi:hypothetical protein
MAESQPIPFSFKVIIAVMVVLVTAGVLGAVVLFNQEPERFLIVQMDTDDGSAIDVFSGETFLGTTPCDVPFALLQSLSRVDLMTPSWPPRTTRGQLYGGHTRSHRDWSLSLVVAPGLSDDSVLHVREIQGSETMRASISLRVANEGDWKAQAIGSGSVSSRSISRHEHSQLILFSRR